jgi:hypothetical protein
VLGGGTALHAFQEVRRRKGEIFLELAYGDLARRRLHLLETPIRPVSSGGRAQ